MGRICLFYFNVILASLMVLTQCYWMFQWIFSNGTCRVFTGVFELIIGNLHKIVIDDMYRLGIDNCSMYVESIF